MFKVNAKNEISLTRGDTAFFTLGVTQNGEDYDYSNDSVLFTVKANVYTTEHLIQKEVEYGQNVIIEPNDTANLPYGDYWYDVQLTTPLGIVDTVIVPTKFKIMSEVTFGGN